VAVYKYTASNSRREDFTESGTIVAASEEEAKRKLRSMQFDQIKLRRIQGLQGLFSRLTANVK